MTFIKVSTVFYRLSLQNSPNNMGGMNNPPGTPRDDGEMGGNFLNPFQSESVSRVSERHLTTLNSYPWCPDINKVEECKQRFHLTFKDELFSGTFCGLKFIINVWKTFLNSSKGMKKVDLIQSQADSVEAAFNKQPQYNTCHLFHTLPVLH